MLIVVCIAGGAALAVVAYQQHLQDRSPQAATAGLRAVRELAALVLVLVKAVEGVVDVLAGHQKLQSAPAGSSWGYRNSYEFDEDER